eukprot:CAMPEP_0173278710 /NCGR_PEP_ID=MMETSP1143-20121109/4764_1 /TAXON_ID=483371 /ORGANISM="non described non described, Strain CCMP2298" /LENGTH=93 /DNA_ID=CAMNT_0014215897 /DNA_START=28 /DNA_END=309 /DNA_ORIENTATION=-
MSQVAVQQLYQNLAVSICADKRIGQQLRPHSRRRPPHGPLGEVSEQLSCRVPEVIPHTSDLCPALCFQQSFQLHRRAGGGHTQPHAQYEPSQV